MLKIKSKGLALSSTKGLALSSTKGLALSSTKGLALSPSKGFTLIELLIVIAIIGILSSIVLVSLSSARNRAYKASALATVSGVGTEIITCVDDSLTVAGQISSTTGGGRICRSGTPPAADVSSHTVNWPTLANTGGYCYSSIATGCTAITNIMVLPQLPASFYLWDTDNTVITCRWAASTNLTCN